MFKPECIRADKPQHAEVARCKVVNGRPLLKRDQIRSDDRNWVGAAASARNVAGRGSL
jgi:hypothetical protein